MNIDAHILIGLKAKNLELKKETTSKFNNHLNLMNIAKCGGASIE